MIHLDRNHHVSPKQNLHKIVAWPSDHDDDAFSADIAPVFDVANPKSDPVTPAVNTDDFLQSPASPADGNSTSPTRDRSSSLSPVPDTISPQTQAHATPPPPPAAEEKEAPVEVPTREEEEEDEVQAEKASRLSTPLSELSPPSDQDDEPEAPSENVDEPTMTKVEPEAQESPKQEPDPPKPTTPPIRSSQEPQPEVAPSEQPQNSPVVHSPASPSASASGSASQRPLDPKVVSILNLNVELLKVCMVFQNKGLVASDPRFQQYANRLQGNLTWLAAAADHSRQGNQSNMLLPAMDAPPPVEFSSTDQIRAIYAELPSIFSKEIARRQQMNMNNSTPSPSLKRELTEEPIPETMNKRRDTGEGKISSNMMPPPSIPITVPVQQSTTAHFSLPISNGTTVNHNNNATFTQSSQNLDTSSITNGMPGLVNTPDAQHAAAVRDRLRQAQIRNAQQQQAQQQHQHQQLQLQQQQQAAARQMSPPSSTMNPGLQQGSSSNINAAAGPSNLGGGGNNMAPSTASPNYAQAYQVLQTPNHPFIQYMNRLVPGFSQLPVQIQIQKMVLTQSALQKQQHDQQQQNQQNQQNQANQHHRPGTSMAMGNPQQIAMQNNIGMGGPSQFSNQLGSPASPVSNQGSMAQTSQNPMFAMGNVGQGGSGSGGGGGGSMDPRTMISNSQSGMMSNVTQHQRQLMLMQQQARAAGNIAGGGNPSMASMNPQQQMLFAQQQQERMRQAAQEHQRLQQAQAQSQQHSPTHGNSPMPSDNFPALRSNSIPGIARATRSPSDAASPMTPRVPTRGPSASAEDYQRMLLHQQQGQAARAMAVQSPAFNQQMGGGSNWQQQQQHQQQQGMQMGNQGGSNYGMSPPGSAGTSFGSVPSPSNSQNWANQGNFSFSQSPGHSSEVQHVRHMSNTPVPQQMMPQNTSPPADQAMPNDFDLFNWTQ